MSRNVKVAKDISTMSRADIAYAFQRVMITEEQLREAGIEPREISDFEEFPPQELPHTGDANTKGTTQKDLDDAQVDEEEFEPKEENLTKPQVDDYRRPSKIEYEGDDEDDDDEDGYITIPENRDYDNWNNEQRRAELSDRNLPVDGNKTVLIKRLRESDERRDQGEEA